MTKIDAKLLNRLVDEEIIRYWNTEPENAGLNQIYRAFSIVIRDLLLRKRNKFKKWRPATSRFTIYAWNF